jgi:hypothetical protein
MDEKIVQEVLHQLFSSLEALDTQSTAVLQFLKDKGLVNDEEFRPYLERAGNASGVRWLAARVRIDHLLAGAMKAAEEDAAKQASKATESSQQASPPDKQPDKSTDSTESKPGKQEEKSSAQAPVTAKSPSASADDAQKEPLQKGKESEEDRNPGRSAA